MPPERRYVPALLRAYKAVFSPLLHTLAGIRGGVTGACRFQPTCSEYAAIAVHERGWLRGSWLALRRLLRCHPGCRGGFDPVPGTWPVPDSSSEPPSDPSNRAQFSADIYHKRACIYGASAVGTPSPMIGSTSCQK